MSNRRNFLATGAALAFGLSAGLAVAQPRHDDRHDRRDDRRDDRGHDRRDDRDHDRRPQQRDDDRRGPPSHAQGHDRRGRGAGPDHRFHRGDRLPSAYRHRQYVVNNWRGHRLSAPPRGYHWVQFGADYVLIAIATGLIAQMVLAR